MVMGPTGAGKSTLLAALGGSQEVAKKTESVVFTDSSVDTPGEAFDMPRLYFILINSAVKSGLVLLVADATRPRFFPAGFTKVMKGPVIGVINKIDVAGEAGIDLSRRALKVAGVKEVFAVSGKGGQGLEALKARIEEILGRCCANERRSARID
jgi:ethanolamine utilization protein EutP